MSKVTPQAQQTVTPADFLKMAALEVSKQANDRAVALASNFVTARIKSDQLKSNEEISNAFIALYEMLKTPVESELMKLASEAIELSMPQKFNASGPV